MPVSPGAWCGKDSTDIGSHLHQHHHSQKRSPLLKNQYDQKADEEILLEFPQGKLESLRNQIPVSSRSLNGKATGATLTAEVGPTELWEMNSLGPLKTFWCGRRGKKPQILCASSCIQRI
ncbi:uncharacterized protein LOC132694049 [Panthera onca]